MADGLLSQLLKTPQQIRQEQLDRIRQESLLGIRAQQPISGARSALPSIYQNVTNQALARQGADIAQAFRGATQGLGGMLGAVGAPELGRAVSQLSVSPQERQAAQAQQVMQGLNQNSPDSLEAAAKRLQSLGLTGAAQQLATRAGALRQQQQEMEFKNRQEARLTRVADADIARSEAAAAKDRAEAEARSAVGGIDFSNKASVLQAATRLSQAGQYGDAIRLFDIVTQDPGSAERDISYFANEVIKCDLNDPKCRQDALEMAINYKRDDPTLKPAFEAAQTRIEESYDKATNARRQLNTINRSLALLDQGRVNIGSFAKTRQGAEKLYEQVLTAVGFEVTPDEAVARTEELVATTGALAAELLASGMFGAGTGISEKDLEFATQMAGASQNLTPEGMRRILKVNADIQRLAIDTHNQTLDRFSPKFWESSPFLGKEGYKVEAPAAYEEPFRIPPGAQSATDPNTGVTIYLIDNQWVRADGTPF